MSLSFLVSFIFCSLTPILAIANGVNIKVPTLEISNLPDYPIEDYIQYFEVNDEKDLYSVLKKLENGDFQSFEDHRFLNKGFSQSYWWVVFRLKNRLNYPNTVIFSPAGPGIRKGTLYEMDLSGNVVGEQVVGTMIPPRERTIESRINSMELRLEAFEERLYLFEIDTRGMTSFVPFFLDEPISFWEFEVGRSLGYGLIGGVLLMAIVVGIFLWMYMREPIYAYFIAFVMTSLFLIMEEDGFAFWFFYGNVFGEISEILIPLLSLLISIFFVQFIRLFFDLKVPRRYRSMGCFLVYLNAFMIFLLLTNLLPHQYYWIKIFLIWIAYVLSFINLFLSILILIYRLKSQEVSVYFLLVAGLILNMGLINYFFNHIGFTTINIFYPNGIVFGTLFMVVVLSLTVINRYYTLKNQKELLARELLVKEKTTMNEIFDALEKERNRIGKDLHDDLGALLSIAKLKVSELRDYYATKKLTVSPGFEEADRLLQMACQDVRFIAHELMPLEIQEKRLSTLVSEILGLLQEQDSLQIHYDIGELPIIPPVVKLHIFRIIKELLNNIVRHSKGKQAEVALFYDEEEQSLHLLIQDNGIGFDKEKVLSNNQGMGLLSITKRVQHLGGEMSIDSGKTGTQICIVVPLTKKKTT
jgi:signal transduction histidine kinase